jgi:hypothetical protein
MGRGRTPAIAALVCVVVMSLSATTAAASAPVFFGKAAVGSTVASVPFTGTGESSFFEGKAGTKITCTTMPHFSGEVTGATEVANMQITVAGCETGGVECGKPPNPESGGEITFQTLAGSLGNVTSTTPGVRLFNQSTGRGGILAEFTCAAGAIQVVARGSVIGSLSGASGTSVAEGKLATAPKLSFVETKGIQKYVKFLPGEGEPGSEQSEWSVGGGPFELTGIEFTKSISVKSTPLAGQFGFTK